MIRILIVEDSPSVALLLKTIFENETDFTVIGQAANGREAIDLAKKLKPDVITMDIRMPIMDGLEATRIIMREAPAPIVVISSAVNDTEMQITFRAIGEGAVSVLEKPSAPTVEKFELICKDLVDTVRAMADVRVLRRKDSDTNMAAQSHSAALHRQHRDISKLELVAIAASTGGPQALAKLLKSLPSNFRLPIVVVQHIAEGFLTGMIDWLNAMTPLHCKLATQYEPLLPGHVYFAPDQHHLSVTRLGGGLLAKVNTGTPYHSHIPSATPLFLSVAKVCQANAIGIVMTGMGADGAPGLSEMKSSGCITIAQEPSSCVIASMPESAIRMDAIDEILELEKITQRLMELVPAQRG